MSIHNGRPCPPIQRTTIQRQMNEGNYMRTSQIIITSVVSIIAVAILAGVALARDPSGLQKLRRFPTLDSLSKDL